MGIIGNRFIDLALGRIGARLAPLAPWPDAQSRALFWGIATLTDSLADAARQVVRLWIGAAEWPGDALPHVARARGMLVPRKDNGALFLPVLFNWRGWIGSHWAQHAISGSKAGVLAGCLASHPQLVLLVLGDAEGWYLEVPLATPVLNWDDGTDWDEGPSWDLDIVNLEVLYAAAEFWGPAKRFLGAFRAGS